MEVGPRDGFQFEKTVIPTERKLAVIEGLVAAGLKRVQVASFVHPVKVPQMADAENLIARLPEKDSVVYSGLVLNPRGLDRALDSGIRAVEISFSSDDTHSRKNAGMSHADAMRQSLEMVDRALAAGLDVRASIQCTFSCAYECRIPANDLAAIVRKLIDHGVPEIALADTTGMATPLLVEEVLDAVLPETTGRSLAMHLHDTRGLGLVNLMTALSMGVDTFDTSLAGMGGCPFVAGAAGNIATEDTAYLLQTLNIPTGVDVLRVGAVSREIEAFFGKTFPGRIHRLTSL
jgi:hydroxymethylglutaryl-CoA lyase